jgi:metal-dependent HD superfamily phosphatase/phosphodiesterase
MAKRVEVKREERKYQNRGVEIDLPAAYDELEEESIAAIQDALSPYPKAWQMYEIVVADPEVRANWDMADYIAVTKLRFNDHGEVHAKVAAASAVKMLELLVEADVQPDVVTSGAGSLEDAFLVVLTGALLHDLGNQIHREAHAHWSAYLALPILDRLMPQVYEDPEQRIELRGFILHAIHCHGLEPVPLTIEAGLVAIADGSDMTKGRGRMAFDLGNINIHSVSALSIDRVMIAKGQEVPIEIIVSMSNSAGIFQVQETLTEKVINGPLHDYIAVRATTQPEDSLVDARIVHSISLKGRHFIPA